MPRIDQPGVAEPGPGHGLPPQNPGPMQQSRCPREKRPAGVCLAILAYVTQPLPPPTPAPGNVYSLGGSCTWLELIQVQGHPCLWLKAVGAALPSSITY